MKAIDIHGMTNMELVRGETDEWYWATDYIHGDLYEAEELFRQGHPVRSNRLYLIHYPDGTVYEAVSSTNRSHFDSDLCFLPPFARRIFRCFRPALPAFFAFWVKSGSEAVISVEDWRAATLRHSPHYLSSYHKWRKGQRFVGVFVHHGSCFGLGDRVKVTTADILIRCDGVAPW